MCISISSSHAQGTQHQGGWIPARSHEEERWKQNVHLLYQDIFLIAAEYFTDGTKVVRKGKGIGQNTWKYEIEQSWNARK